MMWLGAGTISFISFVPPIVKMILFPEPKLGHMVLKIRKAFWKPTVLEDLEQVSTLVAWVGVPWELLQGPAVLVPSVPKAASAPSGE